MPIYPTGLIGPDSSATVRARARHTLKYAETLQSLGTHNFGWLAAAAARLGLGDEAARLLYEKGVAYLLRPNGLMGEESDRFIQNCHVLSDPLYLPPMSECSGAILGAINEMLLQSRDPSREGRRPRRPASPGSGQAAVVRIFPAVPTTWSHAQFNHLLAEGACLASFAVSGGTSRTRSSITCSPKGRLKCRRSG